MKITPALGHSFGVVSKEIRRIYAHNYNVKEAEVCVILQGHVVHILLKGKPLEKLNVKYLHKLQYKVLKDLNVEQKEKES